MEKPEKIENVEWCKRSERGWYAVFGPVTAGWYWHGPKSVCASVAFSCDEEVKDNLTPEASHEWIRSRVLHYRDALNRISPPSAEWVPVGEVNVKRNVTYVWRVSNREPRTATFQDGEFWDVMSGMLLKPAEPALLLCIADHPIEVPPVPGGG